MHFERKKLRLKLHKRRSSVNFEGKTFLPENVCMKINKMCC